jgi:DNA polymerase III sliding clamp (beta) subunit (PCNA family)
MKIKTDDFKKILEVVKPGLASKEIIDQTTSFVFTGGMAVTYNDEICIFCPMPEEIDVEGAIKAEEMYKFLGKVKSKEIEIETVGDEVVMKAGRAKVGFALSSKISLPLNEEISHIGEWQELPEDFNKATKFAAPCASNDMTNPKLTCVHFNKKGVVEASDNYRVLRWELSEKLPFETTLIPATSIKEVLKLEPSYVSQGNGWLHFKNDDEVWISCRTFSEKFVDIDAIIKNKKEGISFVFPDNTKEILNRAEVFARAQDKSELKQSIEVVLKKDTLHVNCESETAWFKETVSTEGYKGKDFSFLITPYLLNDILKETKTCVILDNLLRFECDNWVYISALRTQ